MVEKEITLELKKPETIVLLVFLAIIFVLEVQLTLSTPISFGDEGFHTRMAQWIGENQEYPVWIPFIETNVWKDGYTRPPFWNILEGGFWMIFGNELIIKLLTPMISVLTGIATYLAAKRFYNGRVGLIASIMLVTIPSFITYSVLFYTDAIVTFFTVMFVLMFAIATKTGRKLHMMAAGAFGAIVFMTKLTGYAPYVLVVLMFIYFIIRGKKLLPLLKKYSPMLLIMALIPAASFIRSYRYYGTPICYGIPIVNFITDHIFDLSGCDINNFEAEYDYEGRTVQVGTESEVFAMGLNNYIEFAYGNLWFILLPFFAGLFLVLWSLNKVKESHNVMDVELIMMMLIFAVLFFTITKRAEDTARFSLMWAPFICIMGSKYFDSIYKAIRKYQKYVALIVFIVIMVFGYQIASIKISSLYPVKEFSPSFFEACEWVKSNLPEDAVLSTVWTYRTAYSCQRSVTASEADLALSNNATHIVSTAEEIGITHIFIQKFSMGTQSLSEQYPIDYVSLLENTPDSFEKVFENGVSLEQCIQQGGCDGNIIYEIKY